MEAEDLRELLEERSYGKSTVITTQLPLEHWPDVRLFVTLSVIVMKGAPSRGSSTHSVKRPSIAMTPCASKRGA